MHLSCLLIDVGDNPDRHRPGRLWLRNRYRVHQRLCMAFPTEAQRTRDRGFLLPYDPCGFLNPRPDRCTIDTRPGAGPRPCAVSAVDRPVHVPRDSQHNFLFRIDPQPGRRAVLVVQSAVEPDWDYAFQNARHLLQCYDVREFSPAFLQGQTLRFRLDVNPTKRLRKESRNAQGENTPHEWIGKRVPVRAEKLKNWLARRAEPNGFRVREMTNLQPGYVYVGRSTERGQGHRLRSVRYEGILEVSDPERFRDTLVRGIGPAKAFGFGLLSVVPIR